MILVYIAGGVFALVLISMARREWINRNHISKREHKRTIALKDAMINLKDIELNIEKQRVKELSAVNAAAIELLKKLGKWEEMEMIDRYATQLKQGEISNVEYEQKINILIESFNITDKGIDVNSGRTS